MGKLASPSARPSKIPTNRLARRKLRLNVSTTTYREQSRVFLAQASEELARGDLRQASEKGWGAAAQIVKAAAEARGWEHDGRSALYRVISNLVKETGDSDIRYLFAAAGNLYSYGDILDAEYIEFYLSRVRTLIEKVEALLPGGLNGGGRS